MRAADPFYLSEVLMAGELATERGADAIDRRDDHDADAHRNQGILDRGRAALSLQKFFNNRRMKKLLSTPTGFSRACSEMKP